MDKRAIWRTRVVAAVAICMGAILLYWRPGRSPGLLDHATRVPNFTIKGSNYPSMWGYPSDHELRYIDPTNLTVVHLDLTTGAQTRLPRPIPNMTQKPLVTLRYGQLSNDGSMIAGFEPTSKLTNHLIYLDSKPARTFPGPGRGFGKWSPDSTSWIEGVKDGFVTYRMSDLKPGLFQVARQTGDNVLWYDGLSKVVHYIPRRIGKRPAQFFETTLSTQVKTRPLPIELPEGASDNGCDLSPKGDRVVWWLVWTNSNPSWLTRTMNRLLRRPVKRSGEAVTEGVWVSKPDGSEMREIGSVKAEFAPDGLGAVKWMPDGKRICVLYRRGLYILPVD